MGFRQTAIRFAMVAMIVLPAIVSCSDSEVMGTSGGALKLSLQSSNGAGRYDLALLQINSVQFRPTDPDAQDALGNTPFGLVTSPINIDLVNPMPVEVDVGALQTEFAPLSPGEYEVFQLEVIQFSLQDLAPLMPGPQCIQTFPVLAIGAPATVTQASRTLINFDPPLKFNIVPELSTTLLLKVDGPGIIEVFEGRFIAVCQGTCGFRPAPCLFAYQAPFSIALQPFFSIEQGL